MQSSTRRLPIRALFGFMLKLVESYLSFPSEPLCVVVCPWYPPWVASVMAGSIVNQDALLGYSYTTPGAEDVCT